MGASQEEDGPQGRGYSASVQRGRPASAAARSAVHCILLLDGVRRDARQLCGPPSRRLSSHLVTKLHHAALIRFDLRQMQGDVSVELVEEWDPLTDHDR